MTLKALTLTDSYGKSANYQCGEAKRGGHFYMRPAGRDRGFGFGHTTQASLAFETDLLDISGDTWRFFEGTLGLEALYAASKQPQGFERIEKFLAAFSRTRDDAAALKVWTDQMAQEAPANAEQ